MRDLKGKATLDEYLKVWSKTVGDAMLDHLEVSEEKAKKVRGRGQVNIKKAIPQIPNEEKNDEEPDDAQSQ